MIIKKKKYYEFLVYLFNKDEIGMFYFVCNFMNIVYDSYIRGSNLFRGNLFVKYNIES